MAGGGGQINGLKQIWRDGRCALGAIATIPSVQTVQLMAQSRLDWALIDMERGQKNLAAAHEAADWSDPYGYTDRRERAAQARPRDKDLWRRAQEPEILHGGLRLCPLRQAGRMPATTS